MKLTNILIRTLALCLLMVGTASAQAPKREPIVILSGLTVGGEFGSMSGKVSKGSLSANADNDSQHFGFKFGYASVKNEDLGYWLRGTLLTKASGEGWDDYTIFRPELNMTIGFAQQMYAFGGVNLNTFLSGAEDLDMGKGFQLGAGVQMNPSCFAEAQYITSSHEVEGLTVTFSSIEISIGANF